MKSWQHTESSPDPFCCSIHAKIVVGTTSRRVIIIGTRCNGRQDARRCRIEVKMLDFFDDKSLCIGNPLCRDAPQGHQRYADKEEVMHGVGLGDRLQPQGT